MAASRLSVQIVAKRNTTGTRSAPTDQPDATHTIGTQPGRSCLRLVPVRPGTHGDLPTITGKSLVCVLSAASQSHADIEFAATGEQLDGGSWIRRSRRNRLVGTTRFYAPLAPN
jgi:hypothetical protein